jgi:zinc/manganese transport system substrate-binding protein
MRFLAGVVVIVAAVTGCGSPAAGADGRIPVVASTNVWGSVVQAVGGDAVSVRSIVSDPSADPHSYESKPADAAAVAEAKFVVYNGGGYDPFFTELATAGDVRRIEAFALSGKGSGNEHVWYDLPTVAKVADRVAEELGALDPGHRDTFAGNAKAFDARLDELLGTLAGVRKGARAVATEPVAGYLLEAAGIADLTPEEFAEAVEEETDPPAAAVAEMTELVSGRRVAVLVNNAQTETAVTKGLTESANRAGVPVVAVTETLPEGATGYLDWMTRQVNALAGALATT